MRKYVPALAGAICLLGAPLAGLTQPKLTVIPMSQTETASAGFTPMDPDVAEKLAEYDQNRMALALREAADAAALHDRQPAPDPELAHRLGRQRVAGWLAILAMINRDLPADFDPGHPATMHVSPPPSASGAQLPPGVSPNDVKDPAARQAYIAAIERNRQRLANFGAHAKLFEAHTTIIERAGPSILDAHQTLGLPVEEIAAMVEGANITPADKKALLAPLKQPR